MRCSIFILLVILSNIIMCFYVNAVIQRDPFKQIYQNSCQDQVEALLKQLQAWRFKGVIFSANNDYQKVWLFSQNEWIEADTFQIPTQLLPWKIDVITTDSITWQAKLADFCDSTLSWTMALDQTEKMKNSEMKYEK